MRKVIKQFKHLLATSQAVSVPAIQDPIQPLTLTVDLAWHEKKFVNKLTERLLLGKEIQCRMHTDHGNWPQLLPQMPARSCAYARLKHK